MMKNLFKFSMLIVVMFAFVAIVGCRTTGDTNDNTTEPKDEYIPMSEPVKPADTAKEKPVFDPEEALTKFKGTEEELYTTFKYPSYWSLKKSPGMKVIPGVEKVERWCKFRLESLDASIEVTVLEGNIELDELIPQIKKQILSRYSLKSFLEAPPRLVGINGAKVDGVDSEEGEIDKVERKDSEDEENLPEYKFLQTKPNTETQTTPETQPEGEGTPDDETSNFVKPNSVFFFMLDDDLDLDDDDDNGELDLDDDDDGELDLDDDDDSDGDDDGELDLNDDDDSDDDDNGEIEETTEDKNNTGAKIFKRNEVWLKGKEMWVQTQKININNKKLKLKALEYEGRFVYDQKLYLVKVFAVNRINDNKTFYSIFVCEAENFVRYEGEYTKTIQSLKFAEPKAEE